jgi:hypothetical protein
MAEIVELPREEHVLNEMNTRNHGCDPFLPRMANYKLNVPDEEL